MQMCYKHNETAEGEATRQKPKAPPGGRGGQQNKHGGIFYIWTLVPLGVTGRSERQEGRSGKRLSSINPRCSRRGNENAADLAGFHLVLLRVWHLQTLPSPFTCRLRLVGGGGSGEGMIGALKQEWAGQRGRLWCADISPAHPVCVCECVHKNWWEVVTGGCAPLP